MFEILSRVSLTSWDEAWYGVISRNIYNSKDVFNLIYNGKPFYDHPPFVFWLQAICYKLFGISEFAARFPSFLLAFGTLVVLFFLAKELFSKDVGLFSSLALATCPWFLSRSLSGNLDVPLTFLFVLSFYLALLSLKNRKFLIILSISLAFLFLTKSLVPFTILPVIIFLFWKKIKLKSLIFPLFIFLVITIPWFLINEIKHPDLIFKYLSIGFPGASVKTNIVENILLTKTYLHNGIGNWFLWGILGGIFGLLLSRKKFLPIIIFIAVFLFPFAFSNKGQIWHLIPIYPFWILSFFGLVDILVKKYKFLVMLVLLIFISFNQVKRNWYEIIKVSPYVSDIEILSAKSKDYKENLYLDDDAVPEALFYSGKDRVERIAGRGEMRKLFGTKSGFLIITRDWRLKEENIKDNEYKLIAKDRDKVLILKK